MTHTPEADQPREQNPAAGQNEPQAAQSQAAPAPQQPSQGQPAQQPTTQHQPTTPLPGSPMPSQQQAQAQQQFPQQAPQQPQQPHHQAPPAQQAPQHQTQPQQQEPQRFAHPTQPTTPLPENLGYRGTPQSYGQATQAQQHQPQPQQTQQHAHAGAGYPQPSAFGEAAAPSQPQEHTSGNDGAGAQPKSRAGLIIASLAIGALLGGAVGGGVSAIVASNVSGGHQLTQLSRESGAISLNNEDTATVISGVAAVATPSVVTLEVAGASAGGSGSGVIYSEDGYIVTNAHVVTLDGAAGSDAQIRVKLSDGRVFDGELVGTDPFADLAVVKIDATDLPAIEVADSAEINVGDTAIAIGAPMNLANTVTSGVVSALNRGISVGSPLIPDDRSDSSDDGSGDGSDDDQFGFPWDFRFDTPGEEEQQQSSGGQVTLPVIQTDASINPGNSGGALLNSAGELIGINVAIASPTSSNGTASSAGLGFAIPANLVSRVADSLIAGEQPSHGLLGAVVGDSSQDTDEDANRAGGLITEVSKGGAADEAGLRAGDVITSIDGVPAVDGTSVSALVREHAGGSKIEVEYTRGGKPATVTVELGDLEW